MSELERARTFAHELADIADAVSLPAFRRFATERVGAEVVTKPDGSPITEVDREVERLLRRAIRDRYPYHAVLGEEEGRDGPDDAPCWVVDPVDATKNFVRGNPVFATLIALRRDDDDVVGVVSAPALGSRWDGLLGGPARHDGADIRVSQVDRLADAEVCFGGLNYFVDRGLDIVTRLATSTARQRGFGDFWQHCLVAQGSTDAAMEAAVSVWDVAAVRCIVEAAGGRLTSIEGDATSAGGSAVSSNGRLHDEVMALLHP